MAEPTSSPSTLPIVQTSVSHPSSNHGLLRSESTKDPSSAIHTLNSGHSRRASGSSLSSRRHSLLTPPLSLETSSPGPQRLPRQPSADLAELHNELEIEQEATVNRLLKMIREQQIQNQQAASDETSSVAATVDSTSTRARSPGVSVLNAGLSRQNSFNNRRSASRASSTHTSSPSLQPMPFGGDNLGISSNEWLLGGSRDEATFYMAEAHMLTRENEMLKRRIRELEKQLQGVKKPKALEQGSKTETPTASINTAVVPTPDKDSGTALPSSPEAKPETSSA